MFFSSRAASSCMLLELRPTISTPLSILSPGFFSTGWEFSFGARIFQKYFPVVGCFFQHLTCSRPPGSYSLQMSALMPSVTFISSRSDHQENMYTKWRQKTSPQAKCHELSLHITATLLERLTLVLFFHPCQHSFAGDGWGGLAACTLRFGLCSLRQIPHGSFKV